MVVRPSRRFMFTSCVNCCFMICVSEGVQWGTSSCRGRANGVNVQWCVGRG